MRSMWVWWARTVSASAYSAMVASSRRRRSIRASARGVTVSRRSPGAGAVGEAKEAGTRELWRDGDEALVVGPEGLERTCACKYKETAEMASSGVSVDEPSAAANAAAAETGEE